MVIPARYKRLALLCSCCVVGFLPATSILAGQSESSQLLFAFSGISGQATISVQTRLVALPVRVTDANGDFVSGLSLRNFQVYADGRLQELTLFRQEDSDVTVGLVVDHSRSMGPNLPEVAIAISAFAKSSNPRDEMFVVDFNDKVSLGLPIENPFTHDPTELARAVSSVSASGQTALYDAVAEGLNHLQFARADKKALIIVSDGGDNASKHTYPDVVALAARSQVVIYSIVLVDPSSAEANPGLLRRLSKDTGGIAFFPENGKSVAKISAQIARDLREQYTLGFSPEKRNTANAFHKIRVKVMSSSRGKMQVRTRSGYFDATDKPSPGQSPKSAL
jgi:Ca-activated chloride channel family protein